MEETHLEQPRIHPEHDEKALKSKLLEEKGILETELAELMEQFNVKKAKINHLGDSIEKLKAKKAEMEQKNVKANEEKEKHEKVLQLLPNAEEKMKCLLQVL